jgi:hypothetical protein
MIILTEDNTALQGETAADIVHQLHLLSFAPARDDYEWMEQTAKRAWQQTGLAVRWGSAEDFLADMLAARLLFEGKKKKEDLPSWGVYDVTKKLRKLRS